MVVVGGAAIFIDHIHEPTVWVGTVICLLASTAYWYLRYAEIKEAERTALLKPPPPTDEEGGGGGGKGLPEKPSEATPLQPPKAVGSSGSGGPGGTCTIS